MKAVPDGQPDLFCCLKKRCLHSVNCIKVKSENPLKSCKAKCKWSFSIGARQMPWPRGKAKGKHPRIPASLNLATSELKMNLRQILCIIQIYIYIQISSKNSRVFPISGPRGIDHHSCYICRDLSWELQALANSNMLFWGIAFRTLQKKCLLQSLPILRAKQS